MIPLTLFLLGCAAVYVGTVQAAFGALLRLSLRLLAERSARRGELDVYLEDPVLLFVPTRALLAIITALTVPLFSRIIGIQGAHTIGMLVLAVALFSGVCEFLLPFLIVHRDPERVLEVLLPSFTVICAPLASMTSALAGMLTRARKERVAAQGGGSLEPATENGSAEPAGAGNGGEPGLIERTS
jgi:hypothetical protein